MSDKSNRKHLNSEKAHADKKARRRELYKLAQSNKKDAYLAGRRANSAIDNNASLVLAPAPPHCLHMSKLLIEVK